MFYPSSCTNNLLLCVIVSSKQPGDIISFFVFFLSLSSLKTNFLSQAVSLPCSTVGNPPPRLSWIHRDSLVYSGEQFQVIECGFAGGDFCICSASHLENGIFQVLSDGTLLMKEVRENIEELTCQVKKWPLDMENHLTVLGQDFKSVWAQLNFSMTYIRLT